MKAIEIQGEINKDGRLILPSNQRFSFSGPVKVILLSPEDENIDEKLWMKSLQQNEAFDFLKDPEEDIYSTNDGKPLFQ